MKRSMLSLTGAMVATAILQTAAYAQHAAMPPGMTHEEHLKQLEKEAGLKRRGAAAMGFDQDKATHHFRLTPNGGSVEVGVNDRSDGASRTAIRAHLKDIAGAFSRGDFAKPFATHGEVPPGVATMQQRQSAITFQYEDTPEGGRVTITTADPKTRSAVHEFLRYQIREHHTGDPLTVPGL